MPWFHVTFDRHIPSILRHGLGGKLVEQNWPGCTPGVYLAVDPALAAMIFVQRFIEVADPASKPNDHIMSLRIIVIDDTRIDPRRLHPDDSFEDSPQIRRYDGVIDITGMPILDIDTITPTEYKPGGSKWVDLRYP